MNHHLEVSLAPRNKAPLIEFHNRSIGLRLWHWLFGRQRIVILFPGESIDEVTITEQSDGATIQPSAAAYKGD